jgi:hypothetical protein
MLALAICGARANTAMVSTRKERLCACVIIDTLAAAVPK